jgi:threonine/homoserine/homoserine lactone efflux protein
LDDLIALFLAVIVLGLKPGPYMAAFVSMATAGQWRHMLVFWLGSVSAGTLLYFLLLSTLSLLPTGSGIVFLLLKATAAVIFINMGIHTLRVQSDLDSYDTPDMEKLTFSGFVKSIVSGFFLTLSNPYDILFVLTAIPTLVATYEFSALDILAIRGAVVSADILVLLAYCVPLLLIRTKLKPLTLQRMRQLSGLMMLLIGLYLVFNMFMRWDLHASGLLSF